MAYAIFKFVYNPPAESGKTYSEVSLLRGEDGLYIVSWAPDIAQFKGGGTWQESSIADGRRLIATQWANAIETFKLVARSEDDQDGLIAVTQELRRILQAGVEYWTSDGQTVPAYIEAQASCETETRYAVIKSWSTPNDQNPFTAPFVHFDGSTMTDFVLNVERGHWLSAAPGTSECQEISGLGVGIEAQEFVPTGSTDDAYVENLGATIDLASGFLYMGAGSGGGTYDTGVRFRSVTIANATTIIKAYVTFVGALNKSRTVCNLKILGEQSAAPAVFSTYADFVGRTRTAAEVNWHSVPAWTTGGAYTTIDITPVIQEIVNLGAWASGNNLVLFFENDGSDTQADRTAASFDDTTYTEPTLTVLSEVSQVGRAATCEEEVYVANKHNEAQLTHIYVDDGGVWSANLVGSSAYNLLPAASVLNDAIYFGSDTTTADSGPFCSLVFDIATAMQASANVTWEYWNGAAWHAFTSTEICDNTTIGQANGEAFEKIGVNSVHWQQMSDWATRDISTDGGPAVTGYFVRARATAAGTGAVQQNRPVYSILWPYVTILEEDIGGDIPAVVEVQYKPTSKTTNNNVTATTTLYWSNKVYMALRSLDRGKDFTPFINLQNVQNPDGITITLATSATNVADATRTTGNRTLYNPPGTNAMQEEIRVIFNKDAIKQYYGTYRMLLRGRQSGGALDTLYMQVEHKINTYVTLKWSEKRQFATLSEDWQIIDFGQWQLPGFTDVNEDEQVDGLELVINCECLSATPGDLYFYDLILWPIDEWALESKDISLDLVQGWIGGDRGNTDVWRYLSVDSVGRPRSNIRALSKVSDTEVRSVWSFSANGPAILQANKDQRLWFLSARNDTTGSLTEPEYISEPYVGGTVVVKKAQQYLSMRGAR